jgi:hypothetical protein
VSDPIGPYIPDTTNTSLHPTHDPTMRDFAFNQGGGGGGGDPDPAPAVGYPTQ